MVSVYQLWGQLGTFGEGGELETKTGRNLQSKLESFFESTYTSHRSVGELHRDSGDTRSERTLQKLLAAILISGHPAGLSEHCEFCVRVFCLFCLFIF